MIVRIRGKLVSKAEQSVVIDSSGLFYEIFVPDSVLQRIDQLKDSNDFIELVTYYYFQITPSSANPILVGFVSDIEKDFFLQFIKVSGIGPRAAVRALDKPMSEITHAIEAGDVNYLKTLPGIGIQRAKEIVAKLQGKVGKFGLIKDAALKSVDVVAPIQSWQEEALSILLQLQYARQEASDMIQRAMKRNNGINSSEELLNEIYKQRVKH